MIAPNPLLAWRALMDKINKSSAGKFMGGAADMLLPEKASDLLTGPAYAVRHPIDSAQLLLRGAQDASQNQFEKMYAAPTTSEAIGHGLAGAIPMIGPAAGMAGEEIGAGNTARGLGMASALLAPSLYHGVKPIVSEATGLMEAVKRVKNINAIREANKAARYDALVNSARNANANAAATTPYPPMPDGPSGSLSQLRDDPNIRVSGLTDPYATSLPEPAPIDPLTGLPTRRDALKAGGAAALATAIGARAMEGMGKVPEAAAAIDAPVLGRAAPSALGREGFYRETKHRAVGYSDPNIVTKLGETPVRDLPYDPNTGKLFGLGESHGSRLDPSIAPNRALDDLNPQGKVEDGVGDRFFLTRTEGVDEAGNPVYGKQVYRLNRGANLREALRSFGEGVKQYELTPFGEIPTSYKGSGGMPTVNRIVHSEITPEAALRLNTIEKRAATSTVVGPKGGKARSASAVQDIKNPDRYEYFKVVDSDGAISKVVAVDKRAAAEERWDMAQETAGAELHKHGWLEDPSDVYYSWGSETANIPYEEAKAITSKAKGNDFGGWATSMGDERPNTIGISPRYKKRVSIRLLKDTMAAQIAENKRAAGKGIPPLLAKPPVLQDNPLLSRQDFFAGLRKK